ncbi:MULTISPECIES: hypothetical protein [Cyanophyceae]|uniref:hypothetical protein n=1 Tax=Cyanophyceae TaxID=3028117 RepID=UPI0016895809|nr:MULTISPECIES: hypothetical protein [Cyanophyceae]MBD1918865.1 hypothetical protein [Phormidium sp. FACHB-77]MBD2033292.1 hypothetical protein [Phormidium sp. FACHB-322]MBD2053775.1 hypothetical protein [Leptolyngbya sp. FACHB-60]
MQLRADFTSLDDAIAYLSGDAQAEVNRLTTATEAFDAEKRRILANRDELLNEAKTAKDRARQLETDLEAAKVTGTTATTSAGDLEAKFAQVRKELEADYTTKIEAVKAEREAEAAANKAAQLRANAIAELSKPEYGVINPDHFLRLHGDRFTLDEQGSLFIDLGDFNRQTPAQFVQDLAQRPSEAYLFKPKGGSGSGSTGAGNTGGGGFSGPNPFKGAGNLTEQMKLFKTNKPLYDRLKAEAGK